MQNQNNANLVHRECNLNLEDHLKYVEALVLAKIIDENTGKSIKQNMTAAFTAKNGAPAPQGAAPKPSYNFENSEFLRARLCLLNYLKNLDISLDAEDMKKIEDVVLELEKAAMERKSTSINSEEALNMLKNSNEIAKDRLMTGSLKGTAFQEPPAKTFSRDEIAKMSTAEFIKNEPVINYQLQNGLL